MGASHRGTRSGPAPQERHRATTRVLRGWAQDWSWEMQSEPLIMIEEMSFWAFQDDKFWRTPVTMRQGPPC